MRAQAQPLGLALDEVPPAGGDGALSPGEARRVVAAFQQLVEANVTLLERGAPMPAYDRARRERLVEVGQMALLARDVYLDQSDPALLPEGFSALSDAQAEQRFPDFDARHDDSGFYSRIYHDANTNTYVVVNRGTDDGHAVTGVLNGTPDGRTNWALGNGNKARQADIAIENAQAVSNATGGRVRFVGHSLGGALASLQAARFDKPATVFNPLGLHEDLFAEYGASQADFRQNVRSYVVRGDSVNSFNNTWGLETAPGTTMLAQRSDPHAMTSIMIGLYQRYNP
ncbi:lipase family protein [Qipengyuania qiaonensis]|nr:lipase family protein [Qipengyuania qiaonensis]